MRTASPASTKPGPLYLIAAYEKHKDVNRTSDELPPFPAAGRWVKDENAFKAGIQYRLPTNTTLTSIVERMTRNAPDPNATKRQRSGFWLAATQKVSANDDVNIGWAHAGKSPGDPTVGPVDNKENMLASATSITQPASQLVCGVCRQDNKDGAHYDLGASGMASRPTPRRRAETASPSKSKASRSHAIQLLGRWLSTGPRRASYDVRLDSFRLGFP